MSEWYEVAYPGGPMVPVKGFPRPLYPPDAEKHGKEPSSDGPDVVAYKRTVSRAGRWPWQTFDDSFSNAFSHGQGSDVGESGIAGIQRQQKLDATGWVGVNTFNTLRSIRIPVGLPHAGSMAMDQAAIDLVNKAYVMFGGGELPPSGHTIRQAALNRAVTQVGVKESPRGSNNQPYGSWYGMNGVPWCAIFVTWAYVFGADDLNKMSFSFVRGSQYAYVPYMVADARSARNELTTTDDPLPGDLVAYDWRSDGEYDHVGLFEKWLDPPAIFQAVEGNTSLGNNSNGGEVMRRSRDRAAQRTVFMRAAE